MEGHDPSLLSNLRSGASATETAIIFVNLTEAEMAYYWVDGDGEERYYGKVADGDFVNQHTYAGHIWLVKDANESNIAVFRAEDKTGRALVDTEPLTQEKSK